MNRSRCTSTNRISQQSVLALLRSGTVVKIVEGEQVQYTNSAGQTKTYRVFAVHEETVDLQSDTESITVSKASVSSSVSNTTVLDKISLDSWSITSFDPITRVVCINLQTNSGVRPISITIPVISL